MYTSSSTIWQFNKKKSCANSGSLNIKMYNLFSSGLISFRIDWLDLLAVQRTLKSLLQHYSSKASILRCSSFFIVQLSYPYMPLLLLLLSHFSRVQLCVTPEMAAYQAPPCLGFSRQENWSGLPFLSPMHEREK